ncbi:MAG: hypothetical protein ACKVYV_04000 [Limisphaerales bacterium]
MSTAAADPFADLREALGAVLPALPRAGDALLLASAPRLARPAGGLREWLALRRARFAWQCRTAADGRFRLFRGPGSSRERLHAAIEVAVGAVEPDAPPLDGLAPGATLRRPAAWLSRPDGNLRLSLGPGGTLEVLGNPPYDPKRIAAVWTRGGRREELFPGDKAPWPAALWPALVRALASPAAAAPGVAAPLAEVFARDQPVWRTLHALILEALHIEPALAAARPALPPELAGLRMPWGLHAVTARLGLLVDEAGRLATPADDDTFLLPVDVSLRPADDGLRVEATAGLPDFVGNTEIRDAVRAALEQEVNWRRQAQDLARHTGERVTETDLKQWLQDDSRAFVIRTDRPADTDEQLLLLCGTLGAREAALLLWADKVALDRDKTGGLNARLRGGISTVWAGFLENEDIGWHPGDGGKQLLCDVLHGLLRWHHVIGGGA